MLLNSTDGYKGENKLSDVSDKQADKQADVIPKPDEPAYRELDGLFWSNTD